MAQPSTTPEKPVAPARNADGFSLQAIHLVRTAVQANLTLSQMADQKASILMGATFVVFTVAVGQANREHYPLAIMVLAFFAAVSALLAVSAIIPRVSGRSENSEGQNILFFGAFTHLSEDEFADRVLRLLASDEQVFRTMLRDLYQNGQVLEHKKYRLLRFAYISFIGGLVLTLITLLVTSGWVYLPHFI
ncbi:MAG: Pycsar system effector family protein [Novosphingobium sp.]